MAGRSVRRLYVIGALGVAAFAAESARAQFHSRPKKDKAPQKEIAPGSERFRDEAEQILAPLTTPGAPGGASAADTRWSIVIIAFVGERQEEDAARGLAKVRTEGGLLGAFLERRDKATVIAYGSYSGPEDPDAQADLERIRTMRVGAGTPFAAALLSPPSPEHLAGSLPDLDLRNAKRLFGEDRALYTLQVGIYGRPDRSPATSEEVAEYRRAAEEAAVILRRDGELAFYYHAPERSMVTIGVFGQGEYDPQRTPPHESFELVQLRERHPLNLLNGKGIREILKQRDGSPAERMQPSMLVGVPES